MKISASIKSEYNKIETGLTTNDSSKSLPIEVKQNGFGAAVSGGELLMLSLATCFCNDIYREAGKRNMNVKEVQVTVNGEFGGEGEPGFNFSYTANVKADGSEEEIAALVAYTDGVAEIHNTLRKGIHIKLITQS